MISIAAGARWEGELPVPASATFPSRPPLHSPDQPCGSSPAGLLVDAEGEEAFLEQTTGQQSVQPRMPLANEQVAVLRVRPRGCQEWAATCALLDNTRCSAGEWPGLVFQGEVLVR